MCFIELGLRTYFILKHNRFLTVAIFTGSASTVHNSLKIIFLKNFNSYAYSVSGIRSYFSCSKTPKLEQITALNFCDLSKLVRMGGNA